MLWETDALLLEVLVPDFIMAKRSGEGTTGRVRSALTAPLPLLTALLDDAEATVLPLLLADCAETLPVTTAEFFLSEFNMAIRSEEKEEAPRAGFAEFVLPPTAGLTIGMLAVTESGGAAGAIDSTRGDEELRMEAEGALTSLNDSCT